MKRPMEGGTRPPLRIRLQLLPFAPMQVEEEETESTEEKPFT